MLRKDVKLGFAIGGVMLAVVVVYVLVVPNNDRNKNGPGVTEVTSDGSSTVAAKPDSSGTEAKSTDTKVDPSAAVTDTSKADNVGENKPSVAITGPGEHAAPAGDKAKKGDIWDIALRDGVIPPSMSATPTSNPPADKSAAPADGDKDKQTSSLASQPDATVVDSGAAAADKKETDAKLAGDTQPGKSAETTHVVKAGETLSAIASAAYGDAKAWKRISEANPNVNPNRLAAGTHLVIPPAPTAKDAQATSTGVTRSANVDPQTQYQVQSSDSLYRISVRLYGKADHVDKLYQDNKDVIGADPRHLKLGMVLKLADPPLASVTNASH